METCERPAGSDYPDVLQMNVLLICSISGLQLTAKSSKHNKLEVQDGNNNMQSHQSEVCFQPKGKQQIVREKIKGDAKCLQIINIK